MAYYTQTRTNSAIERVLASLAQTLDAAAAAYAKHRVYNETLSELRSLSDRELTDLGMNRSMLRGIAKEAADNAITR